MSQLSLDLEPALEYELLVSPRARRLSLRVEPGRGLIVTIPKRFPRRDITPFVEANRAWVEDALADIEEKTPVYYRQWPPREVHLQAISRRVCISYPHAQSEAGRVSASDTGCEKWGPLSIEHPESPIVFALHSQPQDKVAVASELAGLFAGLGRQCLPGWLAEHAAKTGLNYKKVSIRGQRSVWGSYSSSGTLSLNYKLLFLRRELVDYVMLHELAHTRYLDHSVKFWRYLESLHASARTLDKELKDAGRDVPPWLELAK